MSVGQSGWSGGVSRDFVDLPVDLGNGKWEPVPDGNGLGTGLTKPPDCNGQNGIRPGTGWEPDLLGTPGSLSRRGNGYRV